jgi:membrane protease subunit HflK
VLRPRVLLRAAGLIGLAVWAAASIYVVRASELAVVLRLGAPLPELLRPGLHFCPRGLERVLKIEATRAFTMPIGFAVKDGEEVAGGDALWLTGDTNILSVRVVVQYQVSDPVRYLIGTEDSPEILRRATEEALTQSLAGTTVDDVLTTGRAALLERVRTRAQALLDGYGAGVHVVSLALRSVDPPVSVMAAFKDVQDARSDREKLINEASGYANETVPRARGEAETMTAGAEGERGRRIESAKGDAERFEAVRSAVSRSGDTFRHRMYLETLERLMSRMRVYVVEPGENGTRLRLVQKAAPPPPVERRP